MMTRRERLHRCYCHQEMDRPAVYVRTGMPANDPTYDPLRQLLRERTELKGMWDPSTNLQITEPDVHTTSEQYADDRIRHTQRIVTPAGELISTVIEDTTARKSMVEQPWIASAEDANRWLSLPMPQISGEVDSFFAACDDMGDLGIVEAKLGHAMNPAGTVAHRCGSDNFAMMTVTDRDILHALCEREMRIILNTLEYLLTRRVGPYFSILGEEYLVPPLHGPEDFNDFNVTYDKPIADRIHDADGRLHMHSHGSMKAVVDGFLKINPDVLHPFEPPPMGDITAKEMKQRVRGRISLEGNIQIADLYERSPDQIRTQTRELIRDAFDDHRGLTVCPTASPWMQNAGHKCIEQFRAMIDVVTGGNA